MITKLDSNHFCEMCVASNTFRFAGGAQYKPNNISLELENWECPCGRFCTLFAKVADTGQLFLISKVYSHSQTSIMTTYDALAKEIYEVKLSKKGSDIIVIYDPRKVNFYIDPLHPDEDIIIQKIELHETFS